jgi:hypothetical protein
MEVEALEVHFHQVIGNLAVCWEPNHIHLGCGMGRLR